MKKLLTIISMFLFTATVLCGCAMNEDIKIDMKSNGSGVTTIKTGVDEEFLQVLESMSLLSEEELKKIKEDSYEYNGVKYYGGELKGKHSKSSELEKALTDKNAFNKKFKTDTEQQVFNYLHLSNTTIYGYPNKDFFGNNDDATVDIDYTGGLSITFSKKIVKTNGSLSKDKKTVSWDVNKLIGGKKIYATTVKTPSKLTVNIASKKTYKKGTVIKIKKGKGTMFLDNVRITSGYKLNKAGTYKLSLLNENGTKREITFTVK